MSNQSEGKDHAQLRGGEELANVLAELRSASLSESQVDEIVKSTAETDQEAFVPLMELNSKAATVVYKCLANSQIRLIKIHLGKESEQVACSVFNTELPSHVKYSALSYVWGSQANPETITLNGNQWFVTRNLHIALIDLRSENEDRYVWIDALAINQTDIPERNRQVSSMQNIYSDAETTFISFGTECTSTVRHFLSAIELATGNDSLLDLFQLKDKPEWLLSAMWRFHRLSYWQRVWITQEVLHSRRLVVLYEHRTTQYIYIVKFMSSMQKRIDHLVEKSGKAKGPHDNLYLIVLAEMLRDAGPNGLPSPASASQDVHMSLYGWMQTIVLKACSDPRDTVFAYYSCFRPDLRTLLPINYANSVGQIWANMARVLYSECGALDFMLIANNHTRMGTLPSWVPQWADCCGVDHTQAVTDLSIELYSAGGETSFEDQAGTDWNVLQVTGTDLGLVNAVATSELTTEAPADSITGVMDWYRSRSYEKLKAYFIQLRNEFDEVLGSQSMGNLVDAVIVGWEDVFEAPGLKSSLREDSSHRDLADLTTAAVTIASEHLGRRIFQYYSAEPDSDAGSSSRYGLGPKSIAKGDKICVIQGCSMPIALREIDQHYIMLGMVYAPGYMNGEAMEAIEASGKSLIDYLLK